MKRRKEPLNMSTSGFLDEAHDYFDPDIMRRYREALAESDLEGGRLPDEITVEWVELGGVRTAKMYAGDRTADLKAARDGQAVWEVAVNLIEF